MSATGSAVERVRRQFLWSALAVAGVTLLAGLVAGAAIRREFVQESELELLRQAEATATLVQVSIRDSQPPADRSERVPVARTLEIARAVGGHDYVEARVIGVAGDEAAAVAAGPTPLLDSLGADPPRDTVTETEVDSDPVLAYVRAIPISPRRDAEILIAIGRAEPLLATNVLARPLLISLGIGAVLALMLAGGIADRIGKRLGALREAAGAIADGDFAARAPVEGTDDIARLGTAFNDMAQQLEGARQRERDFLMSVSHDLRTPLTTIRGYAEALDGGAVASDDLARVGSVLHRQTDRLSRLIEDLTLLARLEAREFSLRPESVDLAAHVEGIVESMRAHARELDVRLVTDLADVGLIRVDPDRVGQVVENLVTNALRYTPGRGRVTVTLAPGDDGLVLKVADTGPGIDPEDLPRVFERLYVAQRYRPVRPEGSGLGLSIVKELTMALDGSVNVVSEVGRGTTVSVVLPRAVSEVDSGRV